MEDAQARALEAVRLAEQMEFLTLHADALLDLGEVLRRGRTAGRGRGGGAGRARALPAQGRRGVTNDRR